MPRKGNYRRFDVLFNIDNPADAENAALFDELHRASGQGLRQFVVTLLRAYQEQQNAPDALALVKELGKGLAEGLHAQPMHNATPHEHGLPPETHGSTSVDVGDLWRVIGGLKEDIAALQCGVSTTPKTAIDDVEQQRQNVLSGKLKGINFKGLTQ